MRPHLKMSGTSYRIDETYVKVGTSRACSVSLLNRKRAAGGGVRTRPQVLTVSPPRERLFTILTAITVNGDGGHVCERLD